MNSKCSDIEMKSTGELFIKCPTIDPLEDDEWRHQAALISSDMTKDIGAALGSLGWKGKNRDPSK